MAAVPIKVGMTATKKLSDIGEFHRLRDELWWRVRMWLANDQAMLPPTPQLLEELVVPTYSVDETGRIRIMKKDDMRKLLQRSPDSADSLCLSFAPAGFFAGCSFT